jgi:MYXO-CTERM domain-containing protein
MKSGPVTPPADSDNEGGCAVSVHGGARQFGFAGALGLGIWLARRRRR